MYVCVQCQLMSYHFCVNAHAQGSFSTEAQHSPPSNYALYVADTVLVGAWGEHPENLTEEAPSSVECVSYRMKVCVNVFC